MEAVAQSEAEDVLGVYIVDGIVFGQLDGQQARAGDFIIKLIQLILNVLKTLHIQLTQIVNMAGKNYLVKDYTFLTLGIIN